MDAKLRPSEEDSKSGVQVIARAASILRSLKNQSDGLSLGQIAKRVGLPRSTVQRIVNALLVENLVIAAMPGPGIRLGPEISALADSARIDMGELLRPYLLQLANATGETVDLAALRGRRLTFIDQIAGNHRLRAVSFVGESFPLFETANGKASLSLMPEEKVLEILALEYPNKASDRGYVSALMHELEDIRGSRLALDTDQHTDGISAIGVAFKDLQGEIYAISIPTPSARFSTNRDKLSSDILKLLEKIESLDVIANELIR